MLNEKKSLEYLNFTKIQKLDGKITYMSSEAVEMFKCKNNLVKLLLKNNLEITSDLFIDWIKLINNIRKITPKNFFIKI